MTSTTKYSSGGLLLLGIVLGGVVGFLVAHAGENATTSPQADLSTELADIRAELANLKERVSPAAVKAEVEQLQAIVGDILLRGDEFSLRADFARSAGRLDGHVAEDFALRDADRDGREDIAVLHGRIDDILSGKTPVGKAKHADAADNSECLGNLPPTDFALADHTHSELASARVNGSLTVTGNTIASGDVQVFGEVVAVGGLLPGTIDIDPKPAIAGMIRYSRRLGALEYCDGIRWNELAVADQP